MDHLSKQDALVEKLRYSLTKKGKSESIRVSIPTALLTTAKNKLAAKTDYSFPITNQTLVNYAILNLLEPEVQDSLRHRLTHEHIQSGLAKLLAIPRDPRNNQTKLNNEKLLELQDHLQSDRTILDSLLTAISWLIFERNGMDRTGLAKTDEDIYTKLRNDDLKKVIDQILHAGLNENDRQRHLNNY